MLNNSFCHLTVSVFVDFYQFINIIFKESNFLFLLLYLLLLIGDFKFVISLGFSMLIIYIPAVFPK